MNLNENHASPQAQKIDNLIKNRQPTGIFAADDLANTIPQANPDFQQRLEDRLIAQMLIMSTGEQELAVHTISTSRASRPRRFYIPLTLAVAMLAVALVGSMLISLSGKPSNTNFALLVDEAGTPTPQPTPVLMFNVLVANQNLPRGFHFPNTLEELTGLVGYAPWPESSIPLHSLLEEQNGIEQLAGKILRTDVYREQPIMSNLLADDLSQVASVGSDVAALLPPDQLAISIPVNLLQGLNSNMQPGMQVDISALVTFVGGKDLNSSIMMQKIVRNATIVNIDDYTSMTITADVPPVVIISALRDEVSTLALLVGAEIPMTIELSAQVSSAPVVAQAIPEANVPTNNIVIPINQIVSAVGEGIQAGDHVSITAQFIFTNVEEDGAFQVIPTEVPVIIIPPTPETPITVIPPVNPRNPILVSQIVVQDSEIMSINSDDNTVTVSVESQDVMTLRWLLDAKIPLVLGRI